MFEHHECTRGVVIALVVLLVCVVGLFAFGITRGINAVYGADHFSEGVVLRR